MGVDSRQGLGGERVEEEVIEKWMMTAKGAARDGERRRNKRRKKGRQRKSVARPASVSRAFAESALSHLRA